jgi:hypothetical protein
MVNKIRKKLYGYIASNPKLQGLLRWILLYVLAPILRLTDRGNQNRKSVLYVGQSYYNGWYLSRALRKLGWIADLVNWDLNPGSQIYYHGEDFRI